MVASFPDLASKGWPLKRSPNFSTVRYEALSGARTTAPKQTYPRWRWVIPYDFLRSVFFGTGAAFGELESLLGFFNARSSDGAVFAYQDAEDYTVAGQGFGSGDGVTTAFQLYRSYAGFVEPIFSATPTDVSVAGVSQALGVDYTLSATGIVTFGVAPANGAALTWTGTYAFLCRFDADSLDLQRFGTGLHQAATPVSFSSELNL